VIGQKNQQLNEKNYLISIQKSDIRHRTQNMLEQVVSLLRQLAAEVEDEDQKYQVKRGENLIFALSSLEETLYEIEDEEQVAVQDFFHKLMSELENSQLLNFKYQVEVESSLVLPVNTVIALALIVAELVTNAIKHAFPGISDPYIGISIQVRGRNLQLVVKDNGVGYKGIHHRKGFGHKLVLQLATHLEGNIEYCYEHGTECKLIIPLNLTNKVHEVTTG
jgi:two-component sensor histidine kinase